MDPLEAFRIHDRVVILAGANSVPGVGLARALGSTGCKVVLAVRRELELVALAEELCDQGINAIASVADVSKPEDCRGGRGKRRRSVRTDHNAGIASANSALRTQGRSRHVPTIPRRQRSGSFWMAQACAPHMPTGSSFVNVRGVLGHIGPCFPHAAYAASKSRVLGEPDPRPGTSMVSPP